MTTPDNQYFSTSAGYMPIDGPLVGMTRFLRRRAFLNQLIEYFGRLPPQDGLDILVAPGSIGCEAVTIAAMAYDARLPQRHGRVTVHSVDLSEKFTAIAREGAYPINDHFLNMPASMRAHFRVAADGRSAETLPHLKNMINFLPAQKVVDIRSERPYDAVLSLAFLIWLQDYAEAAENVRHLASLSRGLVCVNGLIKHTSPAGDCVQPLIGTVLEALDARWQPLQGERNPAMNILRNDVPVFRRLGPAAP